MNQTDEIRAKIDIVELINVQVPLKKAGRNFKGLCPFHNEKTPSFVVSSERQIWRCFGCQKGGDVFAFVMEIERVDFPESLQILAEKAGVALTTRPFESKSSQQKKQLLTLNHLVSEYYHYILTKHAIGERARLYLKNRGITDASISTFKLGFAPDAWNNAYTFLTKKGYKKNMLVQAGLLIPGTHGYYDRFRGRIMFPLFDHRGNILGFSGRILEGGNFPADKQAKYINSPETPLYIKGRTVYGLHATKEAIRKAKKAIIVEGEFDVISSFQAGVSNIVAIKGSAVTEQQVLLLKRFANHLLFALDQDSAGDAAARRGIAIADNAGLAVHVITVPEGKDPDDAARSNPVAWKKAVGNAVPFYDFLLTSALSRFDANSAYGKKQITDELLPIFSHITNTIVQAHYIKALAEKIGVKEETIITALKKTPTASVHTKKAAVKEKKTMQSLLEEYILALLVQSNHVPLYLALITEYLPITAFHPPVRQILTHLNTYLSKESALHVAVFAQTLPKEVVHAFDTAYMYDVGDIIRDETRYKRELLRAVLQLKKNFLRRDLAQLSTKLKQQEKSEDGALEKLNQEFHTIASQLKKLSSS